MDIIATIEYLTGSSFRHIRTSSSKWFGLFLVALSMFVYMNSASLLALQLSERVEATPIAVTAPAVKPAAIAAVSTPVKPTETDPQGTAAIATTNSCKPASYVLPGPVQLSQTGITEVVEPVQTYTIYGASGSEVRSQIQACAPRQQSGDSAAEFTAQTGYYISWQYDYTMRSDGTCTVMNPRVGVHIAMILPDWQAGSTASPTFASSWRTFIANLTTHENGHVELDKQYARTMLTELQSFPASSCDTIRQSVNAAMQNNIVQLNIANDKYDALTNHGATQGAVIPN